MTSIIMHNTSQPSSYLFHPHWCCSKGRHGLRVEVFQRDQDSESVPSESGKVMSRFQGLYASKCFLVPSMSTNDGFPIRQSPYKFSYYASDNGPYLSLVHSPPLPRRRMHLKPPLSIMVHCCCTKVKITTDLACTSKYIL